MLSVELSPIICFAPANPWQCENLHGFNMICVHYSAVTGLKETRNSTKNVRRVRDCSFQRSWSESWGNFWEWDPNVWGSSWALEGAALSVRDVKLNIECLTNPIFCSSHLSARSCVCQRKCIQGFEGAAEEVGSCLGFLVCCGLGLVVISVPVGTAHAWRYSALNQPGQGGIN